MIKDNQKILNRMHVVMDALITIISYALAYVLKFYVIDAGSMGIGVLPPKDYFSMLLFLVPAYVLLYYLCNVYGPKRTGKQHREIGAIIKANTVGMALYIVILYIFVQEINYSRSMMAIFYVLNIVITTISRIILRKTLHSMRKRGYNLKHVLVVGYSRAAESYIDRLQWNPHWGYVVCGVLDDFVPRDTLYKGVKVLGEIDRLQEILQNSKLDEIAIALSLRDYDRLEEIVNICEKSGVHTKFIPDYNSLIPSSPYTEDLMGLPVINIRYVPLTNTGNMVIKRAMDIAGALFGIIITSPILLIIAVLVKITSPGPIIFKQERVGLHNVPFYMYKFRSMEQQTEADEKKAWTVKNDPRVTPIGKFIRKTSLDELPQLFNILKGDMSLVGPRPERPLFVDKFKEEIPRYMIKHQVRPGLTGWAQVNGYRGDTSIKKRIEYDLYYIENWTFSFDIKIILLTFITGFINKNAY
ncbi:MAG: undecaprenyl-phosphate glucose phosphotransferase [Lachnospiraceae bacterium]|nr:undecaprenyl-phosphate glucose phosphotransferase [Lachnospiraceae bacterium]